MRSIHPTIATGPSERKSRAWGWLLLLGVAALLSACGGPGGVRNTSRSFGTVIVDAGHGGHDGGTRSSRLITEKAAALDVAQRLEGKLRAAGLKTVMTRKSDYFVPLDDRTKISNRQGNAIFVSVHFNESRPKPYVHGSETYYASRQSAELAERILSKLAALPGGSRRFSKTARFRVLRNNRNPAVLVECGYLSNRAEAARISSAAYRDQMAAAIAQAVVEQRRR